MRTWLMASAAAALAAAATVAGLAAAAASSIELRSLSVQLPQGRKYTGVGAEVLNEHCLLCHSPTFVDTQPPLSETAWKAEVEKMRKVFGAPISPDREAEIAKVLLERHGRPAAATPAGPAATGGTG